MARILGQEGNIPWVLGAFFKAVVQAVLLFRSETWLLTSCMGRALGSFQHRVARRITGRQPKQREGGGWEYPPPETAMEEAGFEEMVAYVPKRQNTVVQYTTTRPILDLCKKTVRRPGAWVARIWRDQEVLDLAGARSVVVTEVDGDGGSEGEEEER